MTILMTSSWNVVRFGVLVGCIFCLVGCEPPGPQVSSLKPEPESQQELKWVVGVLDINVAGYSAIPSESVEISASSWYSEQEIPENVLDSDPTTFWHLKYPRAEESAWIRFDLTQPRQVDALRIRPRDDHWDQFWKGRGAILEGSDNDRNWTPIVGLETVQDLFNQYDFIAFVLDSGQSYESYRLRIQDPAFLSCAEIRLFER